MALPVHRAASSYNNHEPMPQEITQVDQTPKGPTAFHIMTKPTGPICNLDCTYCFYLDKEKLYPNTSKRRTSRLYRSPGREASPQFSVSIFSTG